MTGKQFYIVQIRTGRLGYGGRSQGTHIMHDRNGRTATGGILVELTLGGGPKSTLCGRPVARNVGDAFRDLIRDVSCRECKARYRQMTGQAESRPARMQFPPRPPGLTRAERVDYDIMEAQLRQGFSIHEVNQMSAERSARHAKEAERQSEYANLKQVWPAQYRKARASARAACQADASLIMEDEVVKRFRALIDQARKDRQPPDLDAVARQEAAARERGEKLNARASEAQRKEDAARVTAQADPLRVPPGGWR